MKNENICYIVGAGELHSLPSPAEGDLVIAADGGLDALVSGGITPAVVVGDLDSLSGRVPEGVEIVRHPVEKDETDSHLSYLEGAKRGCTRFSLYGCTGGRDDHTFANYSLLLYAKKQGHDMTLVSKDYDILVILDEEKEIIARVGATLSVFALGGDCRVTLSGTYYPADNLLITPDFPIGVSNHATEPTVKIEADGALLVMLER